MFGLFKWLDKRTKRNIIKKEIEELEINKLAASMAWNDLTKKEKIYFVDVFFDDLQYYKNKIKELKEQLLSL